MPQMEVPVNLLTDPSKWSVDDVGVWLEWIGFEELFPLFLQEDVDGEKLILFNQLPSKVESIL